MIFGYARVSTDDQNLSLQIDALTHVYEIGTGKGHLTTKLAKISKQVTSIELDSHLFNLSSEKLKLNIRVTLIHQDILQFQFPNKQRYKIVGNIPYHQRLWEDSFSELWLV
ncbi:hypothetical protein EfmJHP38_25600 [Enterococcus faecium]|nr:hypothetical protein EfmJHP38_25600 [Enterococcus faecium]